jgi:dienelactone hydrolase
MLEPFRALVAMLLVALVTAMAAPAEARSAHRCAMRADCWERRWGGDSSRPFRPVLPEPTGPYEIGRTQLHLVDDDRRDPWSPDRDRELMATVTYPARHSERYPRSRWFSSAVATDLDTLAAQPPFAIAPGSVDFAGAHAHSRSGAPVARPRARGRDWPVVLFSPGFGTSRELNTAQLEDLASRGYVVVSFDHTYEAPVEFPGGRAVAPAPELLSTDLDVLRVVFERAIDARVADTLFVLDELADLDRGHNPDEEHRRLPDGLRRGLDLRRVGMLGYSYGGYTAAEAMYQDRRIDAGVNLDGAMAHGFGLSDAWPYLPGDAVKRGLDRPFMLFGQEGHNHLGPIAEAPGDLSWPQFWANQRGWKLDISLRRGEHGSFSDLQALLPQIDVALDLPDEAIEPEIGTVDPDRSLAAQRASIAAFFDLHLRHRDDHLLDRPSRTFPEIQVVGQPGGDRRDPPDRSNGG